MNFNWKIYRLLCEEYEDSFNSDKVCNKDIKDKLSNLRQYLDGCGYNLPKQLYEFNIEDRSTYKFLDGTFMKNESGELIYKESLSMDFKYLGVY